MCGITGIYHFGTVGKQPRQQTRQRKNISAILKRMTRLLSHRGPDDEGMFVDPAGRCDLGFRRLAIIDLSTKGHQPMFDREKTIALVFNGEIYNFKDIRAELEKKYSFTSTSDTEVIINAYKEWGIDCVRRFNGMFSFALYDVRAEKLFLVRDRLGVKPLYYTRHKTSHGTILLFGSEIKSILAFPGVRREVNEQGISSYLSFRYTLGDETLFKNIFLLQPGHYLVADARGMEIKKYWDLVPSLHSRDRGEDYYLTKTRELLNDSVHLRMISDVPIGAYLSGGLDSSIIVALMAQLSPEHVKTFSIGFHEDKFNEFSYARQVADQYHTDHHEIVLSAKNYFATMKQLIHFKDLPLSVPNEVPLYLMSKELKKYITVVLSGEGADEIFGGYGRIFRSPSDYQKLRVLQQLPQGIRTPLMNRFFPSFAKKYGRFFSTHTGACVDGSRVDHFLSLYSYFPFDEKNTLFTEEMKRTVNGDAGIHRHIRDTFARYASLPYNEQLLYVFEKIHLPGLLLRVDTTTMAASVEARTPFVDYRLVEFALRMPHHYKLRWKSWKHRFMSLSKTSDEISEQHDITKYLLKKTFARDLPRDVVVRKKMGFPVPLDHWFKNTFTGYAKKLLLHRRARIQKFINQQKLAAWMGEHLAAPEKDASFGQKVWMLVNLELWLREYF